MEQHLKPTLNPGACVLISSLLCLPAGQETVGELCRQLPGGDPEQASLPAAPSGHHQLRMLEAAVAPARLDDTTVSTDPPLGGPARTVDEVASYSGTALAFLTWP